MATNVEEEVRCYVFSHFYYSFFFCDRSVGLRHIREGKDVLFC